MKLKDSLFTRRKFLNTLIGGWLTALGATIIQPVIKFIFPPYREPEEVILPAADYELPGPNSFKTFPWGSKPGILKRNDDGSLTAFVAVCTHLDCNVTYLPEQRKFYCACHDGWYDENGINIAGPPPRPLRRLDVIVEGEKIIIRRKGESA
ncbi:MAG: plastoquinol--plastocyanin reductase [Candidatus Aminicenantes bacterium]|nr:ubiquinol-cytochrome c reductase iron-sulfur subunit [Candidatus Aminicenantes bacterium]RLE04547.1 MAG: plastoquinol--plastocyanin reductase [Candidatus Aminicenantes bacterium]